MPGETGPPHPWACFLQGLWLCALRGFVLGLTAYYLGALEIYEHEGMEGASTVPCSGGASALS